MPNFLPPESSFWLVCVPNRDDDVLFQSQLMWTYERAGRGVCNSGASCHSRKARAQVALPNPCLLLALSSWNHWRTSPAVPDPILIRLGGYIGSSFHSRGSKIRLVVGEETQTPSCLPSPFYSTTFIQPLRPDLCSPDSPVILYLLLGAEHLS